MFPSLPPWEGIHPLIVHFPIALLLVAPLLLVLSIFLLPARRGLEIATFVLLALGTIGAMLALQSGEAAESFAEAIPAAHDALEQHEALGKITVYIFLFLSVAFGVVYLVPTIRKRLSSTGPYLGATILFLAIYASGAYVLVQTGHYGAQLSHVYNVPSPLQPVELGSVQQIERTEGPSVGPDNSDDANDPHDD